MAASPERFRFDFAVRPHGIVAAGESWANRALVGVYAFAFGALLIALSFRLRSWARLALAES